MGIVIQQSIRNALSQYLGIGLGAVNTILLFPRIYGSEFMGQVNVLLAYAAIFASLGHLGLPHAIINFFPRYPRHRQAQLYSYSLLMLLLSALLFSAVLASYIFWYKDDFTIAYLAPVALGMLFFELYAALAQNKLKTVGTEFLRHVFRRLIISLGLLAGWLLDFSPQAFLIILSVGYLLQCLLMINISKVFIPSLRWPGRVLPLRSILRYSLFITLSSSAALLVARLDIIMINRLISDTAVAYYAVAFFMASVIGSPAKSMITSVRPLMSQAWARNDLSYLGDLYRRTATNQLLLGGSVFLLIWLNFDWIILFLPETFRDIQWVFFWVGLGQIVNTAAGPNGLILILSKKYDHNFYVGLLLIVLTVVFNFLLIPRFGLSGAAFATLLAMALFNGIRSYLVAYYFKLRPYSKDFFKTLIYLVLVTIGLSLSRIFDFHNWWWFAGNMLMGLWFLSWLIFKSVAGNEVSTLVEKILRWKKS